MHEETDKIVFDHILFAGKNNLIKNNYIIDSNSYSRRNWLIETIEYV